MLTILKSRPSKKDPLLLYTIVQIQLGNGPSLQVVLDHKLLLVASHCGFFVPDMHTNIINDHHSLYQLQ